MLAPIVARSPPAADDEHDTARRSDTTPAEVRLAAWSVELSHGERQRLAFARLLYWQPAVAGASSAPALGPACAADRRRPRMGHDAARGGGGGGGPMGPIWTSAGRSGERGGRGHGAAYVQSLSAARDRRSVGRPLARRHPMARAPPRPERTGRRMATLVTPCTVQWWVVTAPAAAAGGTNCKKSTTKRGPASVRMPRSCWRAARPLSAA